MCKVEKHELVQVASETIAQQAREQWPPTQSEAMKIHAHLPLDHSAPSGADERVVPRRVRHHDIESSRLDHATGTQLNNPSRVDGLVSQDTRTREVPVLEKTDKPSTSHGTGMADVLLPIGLSSLDPAPSTLKDWGRQSANPVAVTRNRWRDLTEVVSPYVGLDGPTQQTLSVPPDSGRSAVSGAQKANDKEQIGLSIGRPRTSSGFRKNDSTDHHLSIINKKPLESQHFEANIASLQSEGSNVRPPTRVSWKRGHSDSQPNEEIPEELRPARKDTNQVVTSAMHTSLGVLKPDQSSGLGPYTSAFVATDLSQTNRQPPRSKLLQVADLISVPARPIEGSPRHSLRQTVEVRSSSSEVPGIHPLVAEIPDKKVEAVPFPLASGVGTEGVTSSALSGSKKDSPLARQWVINTPATTHSILPTFSHGANAHGAPSSEAIRAQPDNREALFANVHPPPIPHATAVPTTRVSSLPRSQVDIDPQVKIRNFRIAEAKPDVEVSQSFKSPTFSGAPETAAVTTIASIPPALQPLAVKSKPSFVRGSVGLSNQPKTQYNESPEIKVLKVEDAPFVASTKVRPEESGGQTKKRPSNTESPRLKKTEDPIVTRNPPDEPERRRPSSKESPKKVTTTTGDEGVAKQDIQVSAHPVLSRQDNTAQLRSSKLSTQPLPVITHQTDYKADIPPLQPKFQNSVLAELLSSPQTTLVQLKMQASDKGYPKEGSSAHLSSVNPTVQSKLHGTPPDRPRQELEQKMQPTKEAASISRSSYRKHSSTTFQTMELPPLQENHQVRTADVVTRVRTSDQVVHQRRNTELSIPIQPSQARITAQELNLNHKTSQIPESQRSSMMASKQAQQPLQQTQRRHKHSASLPTSSIIPENPVQDLPRSVTPSAGYAKQVPAQGKSVVGHPSEGHIVSAPSQDTVPMTPASAPSLALKQKDSRQSDVESVIAQTGKKIRRFRLPSKQAPPAQGSHPGTSSKTPNSSPGRVEIPLEHHTTHLNSKDPNKIPSVLPSFNYMPHRRKRTVSGASMEARNGTAVRFSYSRTSSYLCRLLKPSTVVGSPNASMHSSTPLPPPPSRDTLKATNDWIRNAEDRVRSQPKRRRPPPGVVIVADDDAPEDKQRLRRTVTKHRSAAKRQESSNS